MPLCASKPIDVKGNKCETCFTSAAWLIGLSQWEAALWTFSKMEKQSSVQPEHNPDYKRLTLDQAQAKTNHSSH